MIFKVINKVIILVIILLAISCFSVKPSTSKENNKLVNTFYVEEGTQYFVKPLYFKNSDNEKLYIDWTFRQGVKLNEESLVIVNISLFSKQLQKEVQSLEFYNDNIIKGENIKSLFSQKIKEFFLLRFTTQITMKEVLSLFEDPHWKIIIDGNKSKVFQPTKKTKKTITKINDSTFVLFR